MAREDIIGGIRIALSKGQKLEDAMQSFYNAGYKKEDIEQAVSELFSESSQSVQSQYQQPMPAQQIQKPIEVSKPPQSIQQTSIIPPTQQIQQPRITQQIPQSDIQRTSLQQQYLQPIQQQKPQISQTTQQQTLSKVQQPKEQERTNSQSLPTLEEIQKRYQSLATAPTIVTTKQIVSNYENKKKMDAVTIMLIFILALLFGVLAAVFIFRKQIVEILNNLL